MRQMRIGVIGQSLDAVFLTQAFELLNGVETVSIEVPEDPQDYVRILRARRVSAVAVCAPTPKRIYLIRKALDEGIPVLAETPWASDLDSVAGLLDEKRQWSGQQRLIPITPWRFAADLQLARGILAGGALGDPVGFQIAVPGPEARMVERGETPVSAALLVVRDSWLVFDLVRHLFGDVHSLQATRLRAADTQNIEAVEIALRCAAGWAGNAYLGAQPPATPHWLRIEGTEARLDLGWQASYFRPADGEAARIGDGCFGMDNYQRLAIAFADVVGGQIAPWVTDADLAGTLELAQAAQMSLGAGLAVEAPRRHRRIVAA